MQSHVTVVAMVLATLAGQGSWGAENASTAAYTSEKLQEVTVTARRIELEKRISAFVNRIASPENGAEGLARWGTPPACPLVSGLPHQDGEYILGRLSEIAHVAGVPLADEHCHPNLYILVTSEPEALLRGMEKRNRSYTFGYDRSFYPPTPTPASVVDEFIKAPRAVRVWYNSDEKDAWGTPLAYCQAPLILPRCSQEARRAECDPTVRYRCGAAIAGGSHLVFNSIWTLSRVFVVVDQNRLEGVTREQFAAYVAMAGFARLKLDARLETGTTILTLFDGTPAGTPSGMTDWDETFLKSLYSTEQKMKLQRSQISRKMVREIAP